MRVRGVIMDYGGTLDTGGEHWSRVLWKAYGQAGVSVAWEQFMECYVLAERELGLPGCVSVDCGFLRLMRMKADIETRYLVERGYWHPAEPERRRAVETIARHCHACVHRSLNEARPVVDELNHRLPLCLATNFYGNIRTVLGEFGMERYFSHVVESAAVGVRKPDPAIFRMAVAALGMTEGEVAVVGDSYGNDIVPARSIGCHTVWLRPDGDEGESEENISTHVIVSLGELPALLFC